MATAHLICTKSRTLAATGTGKTDGHAILAAVTDYGTAIGTRQSWSEIFSEKGEKPDARVFEVYFADGTAVAAGERWGLIRLQDYVEPVVCESDDDDDDDLDDAA